MKVFMLIRIKDVEKYFKVDSGNIPPNEVDNYMARIINKMKDTFIDTVAGDYNLKFNIQGTNRGFFCGGSGGDSGTNIES